MLVMWVNTVEAVDKIGLSKDTLRRYRKDNILKEGLDWIYGDAYKRRVKYNIDNCYSSILSAQNRDHRNLEQAS
tara:strand:- start:53 stop:274 length:222 start_codon:yes stop_codon:yes gene_type:complete